MKPWKAARRRPLRYHGAAARMTLVLHNYFRSSTSVRVRAALNLKGLGYDYVPLSLLKGMPYTFHFRHQLGLPENLLRTIPTRNDNILSGGPIRE